MPTVRQIVDRVIGGQIDLTEAARLLRTRIRWTVDPLTTPAQEAGVEDIPPPGDNSAAHLDDLRLTAGQRNALWAAARSSPGWPGRQRAA